jgi:hypothetical protein
MKRFFGKKSLLKDENSRNDRRTLGTLVHSRHFSSLCYAVNFYEDFESAKTDPKTLITVRNP